MSIDRRDFLKLVGVTGAGTLTACDAKVGPKSLIPYLVPHEEVTPGVPTWYASTCRECPAGCGIHVKTREGRVIKIEGNPESPVNEGRLCARGQAAHQNLYDPDRLVGPKALRNGRYVDLAWEEGVQNLTARLEAASEGSIVLLSGLQTGTRDRLYDEWAEAVGATRVVYEPFAHEPMLEGNRRVLGQAVIPSYDLDAAEFVISFGADFLETWVSPVRYGREWSRMHVYKEEGGSRGVFVAVEPRLSMTASNADQWVSAKPGTEYLIALGMANVLGAGGDAAEWTPARVADATGVEAKTVEDLARRFGDSRSVALPGGVSTQHDRATAAAAAVALLNQVGGAVGDTVRLSEPVTGGVEGSYRSMIGLAERMRAGEVEALLVADTNPAYSLPPALDFEGALKQVPFRVSFDPLFTETASWCHLLLPDHTPLESWGDWVPQQGVASLVQPAMRPVRNTRATPDVLLEIYRALTGTAVAAEPAGAGLDVADWKTYLREAWRDRAPDRQAWADLLKSGGRWEGASGATVSTSAGDGAGGATAAAAGGATATAAEQPLEYAPVESPATGGQVFELVVYPHIAMYDGRNANRPWLQELADPATTSCWQTWVEVNPAIADRLDLEDGDVVRVSSEDGEVEAPVIVYAGIREDSVAMPLGRGHDRMGRYADNGTNPVALLPSKAETHSGAFVYQGTRVAIEKTGAWVPPLKMQGSDSQDDRDLAQSVPMAAALAQEHASAEDSHDEHEADHHGPPLTVDRVAQDSSEDSPYRWGMAISLDACTGCGACVTACMAENNLPFVGPERVAKSRQMTWLRIERYIDQRPDGELEVLHLPMLCQHCGAAPCEPVCPVYATYHNPDGLNVQVYNRCVGTRYCSNNCPYKVRYFNWFEYEWPEPLNWGLNPDVTTREKGVMEKCTYCVQRINAAKIEVADEGPDAVVPDGYFQTACQQTCPTEAIVFGNLKDPESRVAKLANGELAYNVLEVVNTRPANFYLKQVNGRLDEELGDASPTGQTDAAGPGAPDTTAAEAATAEPVSQGG